MPVEKREYPRFDVSMDLSCAAASPGTIRMHDISEGGFLPSGRMAASVWERIEASMRVRSAGGEHDVRLFGTITHAHPDGERQVVGVRIDGFGSPDEERAYLEYARSLGE